MRGISVFFSTNHTKERRNLPRTKSEEILPRTTRTNTNQGSGDIYNRYAYSREVEESGGSCPKAMQEFHDKIADKNPLNLAPV